MDYLLTYSKSDENWYRLLIEAIEAWVDETSNKEFRKK
jgi:hypothetical protein